MKYSTFRAFAGIAFSLAVAPLIHAQEEAPAPPATAQEAGETGTPPPSPEVEAFMKLLQSIEWKTEGAGDIGGMASLNVPEGYRFTGSNGTQKLMEAYGNIVSGSELAYIAPEDMSWFGLFQFEDVGYVKDDEKDKLDPDEILEQLKKGQEAANEKLRERGMSTLEVLGWKKPPFYNPQTNNLEWAIRLRSSDGGNILNYKTKILGRRGVMDVVLVCDEEQMDAVLPEYQKLLTGYSFQKENSYAAFEKGDKIAEYGLTGLIVGGGLLAAAKTGLLAKLWKPIAVGLLAVGMFIKRIFTGRTGRTKEEF